MTMKKLLGIFVALLVSAGCGQDDMQLAEPDSGVAETPGEAPDDPPEEEPDEPEEEPADDDGDDDGLLACTLEEVMPIFECAVDECLDVDLGSLDPSAFDPATGQLPDLGELTGDFDVGELAVCVGVSCLPEILAVSADCRDCLLGGLGAAGSGDFQGAAEECTNADLGGLGGGGQGGGGSGGLPF